MADPVLPGDSILRTKIRIPRLRPHLVVRQHLLERLQNGLWSKLTLVCAQAGFGKTTLLADWVQMAGRPAAWITLDESDNALEHFLRYLQAAFEDTLPGVGKDTAPILAPNQPLQPQDFIASLINELDAKGVNAILVLDDYHFIHEPIVHETLNFLVDHLPDCLHLVISSRSDPLLPLPRLRARGEINELRDQDLRFTPQESAEFLTQVMGLNLSKDDLVALEARTEGWIAGLQLAALSMRDRSDRSKFIQALTGSNRFILDYLMEEVLQHQPVEIQDFLLQTSILNHMSVDLCQAVTGLTESGALLERLEQANLFIQALDDESSWYRYHTLFADLLRFQLKRTRPDLIVPLNLKAAAWFEANHLAFEAVDHFIAANDLTQAARLVEETGEALLNHSYANRFLDWLDRLPVEVYRARPRLPLLYSWGLISSNRFSQVEPHFQAVEQILRTWHPPAGTESRNMPGNISNQLLATRAIVASAEGNLEKTIQLSNQALEGLSPNEALYSALLMGLAVAYHLSGNLPEARITFYNAYEKALQSGEAAVCLTALFNVGDIQIIQGELHKAEATFKSGLELAPSFSPTQLPICGMAYSGLASLYYEWDELPAALEFCHQAITLCDQWGNSNIQVAIHGTQSHILDAMGRHQESVDAFARASELIQNRKVTPNIQQLLNVFLVENWLNNGQIEVAWQWLQSHPIQNDGELPYISQYESLIKARVLFEQGRVNKDRSLVEQALSLLTRLENGLLASGALDWKLRDQALKCLCYSSLKEDQKALSDLEQVLSQAEPEGYIRLFVDSGQAMAALLVRFVSKENGPPALRKYASRLLTHFTDQSSKPPAPVERMKKQDLPELLSERELQVLRLVVLGLGNQEIAQRLTLAPGTVKRHLHNIFGKLDVSTRPQAIARARELNLA